MSAVIPPMRPLEGMMGTPLDVAWCRQYADRAEREYASMVDGLLSENEQLESLARLLAKQFGTVTEYGDGHLDNNMVMDAASSICIFIEKLLQQGEELRRQREEQVISLQRELREERLESQVLRQRVEDVMQELANVRAEAIDTEFLLSKEEGGMRVVEQQQPADGSGSARSAAQAQSERRARGHEVRRREIAEARSALVESRCQQTIRRLEDELAKSQTRSSASSSRENGELRGRPSSRGAMQDRASSCGGSDYIIFDGQTSRGESARGGYPLESSPASSDGGGSRVVRSLSTASASMSEQVVRLRAQVRNEREAHRKHTATSKRYIAELSAACGRPLPVGVPGGETLEHRSHADAVADNGEEAWQQAAGSGGGSGACSGTGVSTQSDCFNQTGRIDSKDSAAGCELAHSDDDEDYAWEGYLEWSVGSGGSFEKVYLELTRSRLTVSRERGNSSGKSPPLATCPLSALMELAEIDVGVAGLRCFKVVLRGPEMSAESSTWLFRCVSVRRAEQWVEAVNRALDVSSRNSC